MLRLTGPVRWLLLLLVMPLLAACAEGDRGSVPMPPAARPAVPGAAPADQGIPEIRLIARNASLELTVADIGGAVDAATGIAERAGGFVMGTNVREEEGRRIANISLRVPADRYEQTMAELRGLAQQVEAEHSFAQDVTEEYVDLDARLRNLELLEQRYQDLLQRAVSVEDVLKVQQQLGEVRIQIDQIKGRLQLLQRRVQMSQIELMLRADVGTAFRPLRQVAPAWATSLRSIETLIGILVATWWIWPIGLVFWWVLRLRRRSRAEPPAPAGTATSGGTAPD